MPLSNADSEIHSAGYDPTLPEPRDLQLSDGESTILPFRSESPRLPPRRSSIIPSRPRDRATSLGMSLGALHQELEEEEEARVVRLDTLKKRA